MAITDTIRKLFEYRENISDIIRLKDIDIPEKTKLQNIPQYINELEKKEKIVVIDEWSQEFQDQCVAESLANYLHERSLWNGHVDAAGLREIGWTEDDIEYFQKNGVDWNEEDDDKYLVGDYEKELYRTNAIRIVDTKVDGVTIKATYTSTLITSNNADNAEIVEWRNNVRWMPKFTTDPLLATISFRNFIYMIGCPSFDFSKCSNPSYLFSRCLELRCVPPLQFATATATTLWNGDYMFYECGKIKTIPNNINWEKCKSLSYSFADCSSIEYLPELNLINVTTLTNAFTNIKSMLGISKITTSDKLTNTSSCFAGCRSLLTAPLFDTSNCSDMNNMFSNCQSITTIPSYNVAKNKSFATFFRNCPNLLACPDLNFQPIVTTYASMFVGCEKLQKLPTTMDFTSCTSIGNMCERCLAITEFPYKLNLGTTTTASTSTVQGIKTFSNCFFLCTNLTKLEFGVCRGNPVSQCVFLQELNVDDFDNTAPALLAETNMFNVVRIGGELKGINVGFDISKMRKLPRESLLHLLNALEDVSGLSTKPKLTIGSEGLRNLTLEDKLIATNKGWILG